MILERLKSFSDFASKVTRMSSIKEAEAPAKEEGEAEVSNDEKIKELEGKIAEIDKKIKAKNDELAELEPGSGSDADSGEEEAEAEAQAADKEVADKIAADKAKKGDDDGEAAARAEAEKDDKAEADKGAEMAKGKEEQGEEKVKKADTIKKADEITPADDLKKADEITPAKELKKKKEKTVVKPEKEEEDNPDESVNPRTVGEAINQLYGADTSTMSPGAQQFVSGQSLRNPNTNVQPAQPDLKAMDELMHPDDKKILAGAGPSGMPNNNIADRMRDAMKNM